MKKEFRKEKILLTTFFVAITLLALVLSVFLAYFDTYGDNLFVILGSKSEKAENYAKENTYAQKGITVFFGDSLTEFCDTQKFYPSVPNHNRGISGDTTQGMLDRLDSNLIALQPSTIVFLGGANDLNRGVTPEQIASNIESIFSRIRTALPDCRIVVQSLYPVNPDTRPVYLNAVADRKNSDIDKINSMLPQICEKYGCVFVNIHDELTDEQGRLKKEYTRDGLHVTDEAYTFISQFLTPYIAG